MICTRSRLLLKWKWKRCNLLTISPVDVEKWKNISFHKKTLEFVIPVQKIICCSQPVAWQRVQWSTSNTRRRHYLSPHTHYLTSLRCLPRTELATRLVHMSAPHLICCSLPQQIQLTTHMYIKVTHTHTELSLWLCWRHDLSERATHTHNVFFPHPRAAAAWAPGKNDRAAIVFVILAQFDIQREKANDVLLAFLLYSQPQSTKQNVPDIVHHNWQVANYHQVEVSVESRLVSLTPDHLWNSCVSLNCDDFQSPTSSS